MRLFNVPLSSRIVGQVLCFLCLTALPTRAQKLDAKRAFLDVPFEKWLADGPHTELPWKTHVAPPELSFHQRMVTQLEIQINGEYLERQCCEGNAVALVQITDWQGHIYRNFAAFALRDVKPGASQYAVNFDFSAFLLPGTYRAALAFYVRGGKEYNVGFKDVRVDPVKNDPLPNAWEKLPSVEFFDADSKDADDYYRPEITGRLHLPLVTQFPVKVQILVNLTPDQTDRGRSGRYRDKLAILLPVAKTLSQVDVNRGSLELAVIDLAGQRTTFEEDDLGQHELSWSRLKDAVVTSDAATVNVHELSVGDKEQATFFADELTRRLQGSKTSGTGRTHPLRVLILVSGPRAFGYGKAPRAIVPSESRDFVVYYLKCEHPFPRPASGMRVRAISLVDDIGNILSNFRPRILEVESPQDLRKAIARIIEEVSQKGNS